MSEVPKRTQADYQASYRERARQKQSTRDDAFRRILTEARTIREARQIVRDAIEEYRKP